MGLLICYWLLSLLFTVVTEGFTVQGPAVPLSVQLGGHPTTSHSVTLPCWVDTPLPVDRLEVEWMRPEFGTLVHLFQDGQTRPESQHPSYSSRAEFFTEEIPKGNFSLLLKNLNPEDMGMYRCIVHTDLGSSETNLELHIESLVVTGASEPVFAYTGEDVILTCSVDTHVPVEELEVEWVKMDQEGLVLLFQEGQNQPESQHERFRGRAEFFTEEIPKGNFSLKLRGVRTEDRGEYMCKVHTDTESVSAKARLRELGFSSLHISVLVLSIAAPIVSLLGVCLLLVLWDSDEYFDLVFYTSMYLSGVMICAAFIIWGVAEGAVGEAYTCSAINLTRILMLVKISDISGIFIFKHCAPVEHFIILTGVNSDVLWTVYKEHTPVTGYEIAGICVFVIMLLVPLPAVFLRKGHNVFFGADVVINVLETWFLGLTFGIISPVYFVLSGIGAVGVTISIILKEKTPRDWTERAHLYRKMSLVGFFLLALISSFMYLDIILEKHKEHHAWMCLMAFLYILAVTAGFEFRDDFTDDALIPLVLFGVFGLPIVNGVAVAVKLIQKAAKGERTVEDLRVIVIPFECFFFTWWIGLQVYEYWKEKGENIKEGMRLIFQTGQTQRHDPASSAQTQEIQEMKPLSQSEHDASNSQQKLQEDQELEPQPEPNMKNSQEEIQEMKPLSQSEHDASNSVKESQEVHEVAPQSEPDSNTNNAQEIQQEVPKMEPESEPELHMNNSQEYPMSQFAVEGQTEAKGSPSEI